MENAILSIFFKQPLRKRCLQFDTIKNVNENLLDELRGVLGFKITENHVIQILERLDERRLNRIISVWPTPYCSFKYKDQGRYLPFEQASLGQQASALLTVMLNQEAGPLIIDQLEDDLDNRIIMSIVKQVQTTKHKRKLIFATHNANFVL